MSWRSVPCGIRLVAWPRVAARPRSAPAGLRGLTPGLPTPSGTGADPQEAQPFRRTRYQACVAAPIGSSVTDAAARRAGCSGEAGPVLPARHAPMLTCRSQTFSLRPATVRSKRHPRRLGGPGQRRDPPGHAARPKQPRLGRPTHPRGFGCNTTGPTDEAYDGLASGDRPPARWAPPCRRQGGTPPQPAPHPGADPPAVLPTPDTRQPSRHPSPSHRERGLGARAVDPASRPKTPSLAPRRPLRSSPSGPPQGGAGPGQRQPRPPGLIPGHQGSPPPRALAGHRTPAPPPGAPPALRGQRAPRGAPRQLACPRPDPEGRAPTRVPSLHRPGTAPPEPAGRLRSPDRRLGSTTSLPAFARVRGRSGPPRAAIPPGRRAILLLNPNARVLLAGRPPRPQP